MTVPLLRQVIDTAVPQQQARAALAKAVTSNQPRRYCKLTKAQLLLVLEKLLARSSQAAPGTSSTASPSSSSSATTSPATSSTSSSSSSSSATASPAISVDTVMGLFLHSQIAHLGSFFEKMDLKNVSTERGEGFNHFLKWVLRHFSCHNLETPQPFRQVFIRWSVGIPLFESFYERNTTVTRIAREFKDHTFEELTIDSDLYATDLQVFLPYLARHGYKEGVHWAVEDDGTSPQLIFKTLPETIQVFKRYG